MEKEIYGFGGLCILVTTVILMCFVFYIAPFNYNAYTKLEQIGDFCDGYYCFFNWGYRCFNMSLFLTEEQCEYMNDLVRG